MTPRRTARGTWAAATALLASLGAAACRVEPEPDRVALVGWLDRRYADCVLGTLRGMGAAPGPAEAVARAVLASCEADYRAYESAFYSAYGRTRASDLWLGRYRADRNRGVLRALAAFRGGGGPAPEGGQAVRPGPVR